MNTNPLSSKAVNRAVLSHSLQHPLVLYSATTGILLAAAGVVFHWGHITLIAAASGIVISMGSWLYQFFVRREYYSQSYFALIHQQLSREKSQKLTKLKKELRQVDCENGIKQLELLEVKYRNFEDILASKFSPTEMTYSRYLSIAEQVYLAALDNLDKVFLTLKSISAVDTKHLQQRIEQLASKETEKAKKERQTLEQRLHLHQQQLDRTTDMMLDNERALTELDEVSAKIATVQIDKGRADLDLDRAMEELRHLAKRSDRYSR